MRLHTEILEEMFGPIKVEIIFHSKHMRKVRFVDEFYNTCRTYVMAYFMPTKFEGELKEIDEKIQHGELIGQTFKDHGYEIRKVDIAEPSIFESDLPDWLIDEFQTQKKQALSRRYIFRTTKDGKHWIDYALVVEIYNPDDKWEEF